MRTWFITGISRGLGHALAHAALAEGDAVIGTVRDKAPDLATGSGTLHVMKLDLADAEAARLGCGLSTQLGGRSDDSSLGSHCNNLK